MDVLDVTIVDIALPHAQRDLGFSHGDRQWIVTAYSLAYGSLLLLSGRVCDLVGHRTMLLTGLVAFACGSALGGAAPGFAVLVTARALQGTAGAIPAPAALSPLSTTFTQTKERAKASAVFGAISGSGAAVGMLLGGILTQYLNWRSTLYVNVVIAAVALIGTLLLIPRQTTPAQRPRPDTPGALIASAGLLSIAYGFADVEAHSWSATSTWGFLAAGAVLLAGFTRWQTRATNPLLPLRIPADRTRGGAHLAIFISGIGLFARSRSSTTTSR
ncbi:MULTISPECIES: MFS transporter [unclassified Streptomyces]|uniref:MFS transporter n=1 Tax=unclassified Streptomyces TaxID=2593676 RepID=UPI0003A587D9|nr:MULTISPECIES: MFS transporter [unclassified Streptomyces]